MSTTELLEIVQGINKSVPMLFYDHFFLFKLFYQLDDN